MSVAAHSSRPTIEKYILLLSSSEVGLGSLLHGYQIPFGGHLLSLNQGVILTKMAKESGSRNRGARNVITVSASGAGLKLLSPMGKKITPMLAIAIQGLWFAAGLFFLGANSFGIIAASVGLALWGIAQPFVFGVLFFGETLVSAVVHFNQQFSQALHVSNATVPIMVTLFAILKVVLSLALNLRVWRESTTFDRWYENHLLKNYSILSVTRTMDVENPWRRSFRDLLAPWILFSIATTGAFVVFVQKAEWQSVFLYLLRPIVVAWLGFYFIRRFGTTLFRLVSKHGHVLE